MSSEVAVTPTAVCSPAEAPAYNADIKKVLKSYQTTAMTSLNGPNSCMAAWAKLHALDHPPPEHPAKAKGLGPASGGGGGGGGAPVGPLKKGGGPCRAVAAAAAPEYDPFLAPPPFPIQQVPILTAADQSRSERSETGLEGEAISCFIVGGEKRLCLPQILNTVLRDFSLPQINAVCDELQIFCSRCNPEQLEVLKVTGILPFSAPSCGLITKTDAERLCNSLLHSNPPRVPSHHHLHHHHEPLTNGVDGGGHPAKKLLGAAAGFKVYHECFGKCVGVYTPDQYAAANALCIECTTCHGYFSPQKFVCHAHKALENRTCHWGFDSANWRAYILLAKDQPNTEELQRHLDEMKVRYDFSKYKRKQNEQEEKDLSKKVKFAADESYLSYGSNLDPMLQAYLYPPPAWSRVSAFRPWSPMVGKDGKPSLPPLPTSYLRENVPQSLPPFLSQGPPILLNPERVVPISETERFERHYQPNVALAPASAQLQASQKIATSVPGSAVIAVSSRSTAKVGNQPSRIQDRTFSNAMTIESTNLEVDLSTDTDETLSDSTVSAAESSDYVHDILHKNQDIMPAHQKPSPNNNNFVEHSDLDDIRKILEHRGVQVDVMDDIIKEVDKLCLKYREELSVLLLTKKSYQQEIENIKMSKREKVREAAEAKRLLRKELEQVHIDHERKMREALEIQQQLRRELEATKSRRGDKIHEVAARANLTAENELLRARLEAAEAEVQTLRKELKKETSGASELEKSSESDFKHLPSSPPSVISSPSQILKQEDIKKSDDELPGE